MTSSNTSKKTKDSKTPKKKKKKRKKNGEKKNGGVMDVCAASVFEGNRWRLILGAFAMCQGRTQW